MNEVLLMKDITKSFFKVPANDHVSLSLRRGEIHALLGENGAGKTTLMNILYGIYRADSGEIYWKGKKVDFRGPTDAIACRIGMVHQHFTLVSPLTVSQNITLGLKSKGYPFTDRAALDEKLRSISERYGLSIEPGRKVSTLSVGEQQRVEIMKLLYRDVELLILDEPTAVLTPGEIKDFFLILRKLKKDGKSVIIITHRIAEVMEISDRVTILRDGKRVCSTDTSSLSEKQLSSFMIGRELTLTERTKRGRHDGQGLVISHLTVDDQKRHLLHDVSLSIEAGEILGIAGVDGNGQKPLAEAIVGIRKTRSGTITLDGKSLEGLDTKSRKSLGIAYISDDRQADSLIMDMSLEENMILRSDRKLFIRKGFIDPRRVARETEEAVKNYSIKTHSTRMPVRLLSGGNQQKLILSREIHEGCRLIIALQPTRGLDIGATEFVRRRLLDCRREGCPILLISADLEEIFSLSDKVAVMHGGEIMGEVENTHLLDMTEIGLMMAGRKSEEKE